MTTMSKMPYPLAIIQVHDLRDPVYALIVYALWETTRLVLCDTESQRVVGSCIKRPLNPISLTVNPRTSAAAAMRDIGCNVLLSTKHRADRVVARHRPVVLLLVLLGPTRLALIWASLLIPGLTVYTG